MRVKIGTLTIDRYRGLRHLKMTGLGRVNLITGRNNTGKSSVLEAVRILASGGSPAVLSNILQYREEDFAETGEPATESAFPLSTLFTGFPERPGDLASIELTAEGNWPTTIAIKPAWFSEVRDLDGTLRLVPTDDFSDLQGTLPGLLIVVDAHTRMIPYNSLQHSGTRWMRPDLNGRTGPPCVLVGPYGGEGTAALGSLWDRVALSDEEKDVVEALRIIDPEISAVSMVAGEGSGGRRTAIVRAKNLPRPVPLRTFGDGLNRLFRIILSLVNSKNGFLLVDEFENGMHHTVQLDAWRIIFRLARKLDIQVFATSHSWDSIEAFQKAASETPEEGVLLKLARKDGEIAATTFPEDELAVATRQHIEVR